MGWECFCVVGFDLGPLLQGGTRILHLQYFFKYVLTYFLHLNSYLVTFLHNTICRAQLFCPFLLSASEFLSNMLFNYHLLYFCTALSLIIMLSSHYHLHKSKTLSQLTQFTGTLLLFKLTPKNEKKKWSPPKKKKKKKNLFIIIVNHTKWVLQKIPSEYLWCERWPVWGYVGVELAQSSFD